MKVFINSYTYCLLSISTFGSENKTIVKFTLNWPSKYIKLYG